MQLLERDHTRAFHVRGPPAARGILIIFVIASDDHMLHYAPDSFQRRIPDGGERERNRIRRCQRLPPVVPSKQPHYSPMHRSSRNLHPLWYSRLPCRSQAQPGTADEGGGAILGECPQDRKGPKQQQTVSRASVPESGVAVPSRTRVARRRASSCRRLSRRLQATDHPLCVHLQFARRLDASGGSPPADTLPRLHLLESLRHCHVVAPLPVRRRAALSTTAALSVRDRRSHHGWAADHRPQLVPPVPRGKRSKPLPWSDGRRHHITFLQT
mmetsp:Transcript_19980/g.40371  ORF Transcript_19980/g.40371 Transcript_19980/m.40371 type:complete len:270 (+) Transcript_19980:3151-3960(+)